MGMLLHLGLSAITALWGLRTAYLEGRTPTGLAAFLIAEVMLGYLVFCAGYYYARGKVRS